MQSTVLSAIISGVATVLAALITAWSVRGVRGGDARQTTEPGMSQGPRSQAQDRQPQENEIELVRERQRGRIAILLVLSLLAIVVLTLWYVLTASSPSGEQETNDLANILQTLGINILTPLVGVIGAVVGFYYGVQTERFRRDSDNRE